MFNKKKGRIIINHSEERGQSPGHQDEQGVVKSPGQLRHVLGVWPQPYPRCMGPMCGPPVVSEHAGASSYGFQARLVFARDKWPTFRKYGPWGPPMLLRARRCASALARMMAIPRRRCMMALSCAFATALFLVGAVRKKASTPWPAQMSMNSRNAPFTSFHGPTHIIVKTTANWSSLLDKGRSGSTLMWSGVWEADSAGGGVASAAASGVVSGDAYAPRP